jgi:hypothetical protein
VGLVVAGNRLDHADFTASRRPSRSARVRSGGCT